MRIVLRDKSDEEVCRVWEFDYKVEHDAFFAGGDSFVLRHWAMDHGFIADSDSDAELAEAERKDRRPSWTLGNGFAGRTPWRSAADVDGIGCARPWPH